MKEIENVLKENLYYNGALKILETQLEIVKNDLMFLEDIEINYIKTRIKSVDSIKKKLEGKGLNVTLENLEKLSDIVGARVVTNFIEDIYSVITSIRNNTNFNIIKEKDYISYPKKSGYRAYHIIVSIPVSINGITREVKAEIQIRTTAMDFWGANEHKLNYKISGNTNQIKKKLYETANALWEMDIMMDNIYKENKRLKKLPSKKTSINNVIKRIPLKLDKI